VIGILVIALLSTLIEAKEIGIDLAWQLVQERNDGLKAGKNSVKHSQVVKEGTDSMLYMPSIDLHGSYTHLSEPINLDFSDPLNVIGASSISKEDTRLGLSEQDIFLANISIL
jgi:hypothetical protein